MTEEKNWKLKLSPSLVGAGEAAVDCPWDTAGIVIIAYMIEIIINILKEALHTTIVCLNIWKEEHRELKMKGKKKKGKQTKSRQRERRCKIKNDEWTNERTWMNRIYTHTHALHFYRACVSYWIINN